MKVYEGANIRNVAVVGHGHAGKTSLVSAMLYTSGASPRFGRVDDGSATTDWDDEEIARKMSISAGLAYVEWGKTKINIVDTPGFSMFVHEAKMVLPVVDAAIVIVDGVAGVEVVTQRVWNYCEEFKTPRLIVVSRMDRDRIPEGLGPALRPRDRGVEQLPGQHPGGRFRQHHDHGLRAHRTRSSRRSVHAAEWTWDGGAHRNLRGHRRRPEGAGSGGSLR